MAIPTENRDYPEWHQGRPHYALWYIELNQPEICAYLHDLQSFFKEFLIVPNQQQFHITVFICGFLNTQTQYNDDFLAQDLQQHLQVLKAANLPSLQLTIGGLNSFSSALFVEVKDQQQVLTQIRQVLAAQSQEIAALHYCPHVTLGLYRQAFVSDLILQKMQQLPQKTFEVAVDQLTFGYYHAAELQGRLHSHTLFKWG